MILIESTTIPGQNPAQILLTVELSPLTNPLDYSTILESAPSDSWQLIPEVADEREHISVGLCEVPEVIFDLPEESGFGEESLGGESSSSDPAEEKRFSSRWVLYSWMLPEADTPAGKRPRAQRPIMAPTPVKPMEPGCLAAFCRLLSYTSLFGNFGSALGNSDRLPRVFATPPLFHFPTLSAFFEASPRAAQNADFFVSERNAHRQFKGRDLTAQTIFSNLSIPTPNLQIL